MKYFQSICEIENHLLEVIKELQNKSKKYEHLEELYNENNIDEIQKELLAIKYLKNLQFGLGYHEKENLIKPEVDVINNCLNRHLFYIEKIFGVKQDNLKEKNHKFPTIVKRYKACKYYLFEFTKKIWYEKLPYEILSYNNKYKK